MFDLESDRRLLRRIDWRLALLLKIEAIEMATLTDIQNDVASESTVIASATALLAGLSQQLKDALAANDPAAIQAVIDGIDANKANLSAAIAANTPAAPPGNPAPAPVTQ